MSKLNEAGLGVYNNYGTRTTDEGRSGEHNVSGDRREIEFDFRGDDNAETLTATIPAGAKIQDAMVNVSEAFVGITDIKIGTSGSEILNGVLVPVTAGKTSVDPIGTWGSVLTSDTQVSLVLTGTKDGKGNAKVVIHYLAV